MTKIRQVPEEIKNFISETGFQLLNNLWEICELNIIFLDKMN